MFEPEIFWGRSKTFYVLYLLNERLLKRQFYHKMSGDSMRQWIPHISDFKKAIWDKLNTGYGVEVTTDPEETCTH